MNENGESVQALDSSEAISEIAQVMDTIIENIVSQTPPKPNILYSPLKFEALILPNYHGNFHASEISSLIGKNPNLTKTQALYNLLRKNPIFKKLIDRFNNEYDLDKHARVIERTTKRLCTNLARIASKSVDFEVDNNEDLLMHIKSEVKLVIKNCHELQEENLDDGLMAKLECECNSEIFKKRGSKLEDQVLNEIESEKNITISQRNEKVFCYWDKRAKLYQICGKIDGFIADEKCIVEVKNRVSRKEFTPVYDSIQCLVYMRLINCKRCCLVEKFPDRTKRVSYIDWDASLFNEIHEQLTDLVLHVRTLTPKKLKDIVVKYHQEYL